MNFILQKGRHLAVALLLAAVLCGLLWPAISGRKVLVAADLLRQSYPWAALPGSNVPPHNIDLGDNVFYYLPSRALAAAAVRSGHVPLWNPYILCGTPYLANGESGVFSPLNVFFYLVRPAVGFGLTAYLQLWLAGFFFYLLLREFGCRTLGAAFGATVFMLNGFFIVWLEMINLTAVALWLPLLIYALERWLKKPTPGRCALVVLTLTAQFLVGFLQVSMYVLMAAILFAIFRGWQLRQKGVVRGTAWALGSLAGMSLIAAAIAAVQLASHVKLIGRCHRVVAPVTWSVINPKHFWHLVTFVLPNAFGSPVGDTYTGALNYTELCGYVGILPLILAMVAFWRPKNRLPLYFGGLALFALLIYLETPLNALLYFVVPGYKLSMGATRVVCLLTFALAALAGFGFDRLVGGNGTIGWPRLAVGLAIFGLTTADLVHFGRHHLTFADESDVYPHMPVLDFLKEQPGTWRMVGTQGVFIPDTAMMYGLQDVNGYESLFSRRYKAFMKLVDPAVGHDPNFHGIILSRLDSPLLDLLNVRFIVTDHTMNDDASLNLRYNNEVLVYERPKPLPRAFVVHRFRILTEEDKIQHALARSDFRPGEEVLLTEQPEPSPMASSASDDVSIEDYQPEQVTVRASLSAAGVLVLADKSYPGWRVSVDGTPAKILAADYILRGVALNAGDHHIVFSFRPASFRVGVWVSLVSLAAFLLSLVVWSIRRRVSSVSPPAAAPELVETKT